MEKKINYNFMLSLKELCLRRVAVLLWTRPCIVSIYTDKNKVLEDMRKLNMPIELKKQMEYLLEHIRLDIKGWKDFHSESLGISFEISQELLSYLCWTNLGTLDYRKSAEKLMEYETLDVIKCYKLACSYCLKKYIPDLWDNLSEESKYFYGNGPPRNTELSLAFCWPHILKGEQSKINLMLERPWGNNTTFNRYAFEHAAVKGIKKATEYFFQELTHVEREDLLFKTVQSVILVQYKKDDFKYRPLDPAQYHTFWYLMSLLSFEEQKTICGMYPYEVMLNSLQWPWQDISLNIVELVWPWLEARHYIIALQAVCMKIESGLKLTKLFQELFLNCNRDLRKNFVEEECQSGVFFRAFFKVEDSETLKIVFRAIDSVDRRKFVFSECFLECLYESILRKKCGMVQLCLQEAILSSKDKEAFKSDFLKFFIKIERVEKHNILKVRTIVRRLLENEEEPEINPSGSMTSSEIDAIFIK